MKRLNKRYTNIVLLQLNWLMHSIQCCETNGFDLQYCIPVLMRFYFHTDKKSCNIIKIERLNYFYWRAIQNRSTFRFNNWWNDHLRPDRISFQKNAFSQCRQSWWSLFCNALIGSNKMESNPTFESKSRTTFPNKITLTDWAKVQLQPK